MNILLFIILPLFYQPSDDFKLRSGDLIFQEACKGDSDNTIKEVTSSIGDYQFTHVGIVYIDEKDSIYVLEATRPKVTLTPLRDYLYPQETDGCYPKSVVGRLMAEYEYCIPQALKEGMTLIGKDYDDGFILDNDKYYCSELIYNIFLKANDGIPIFPLNTMTFKSTQTGEITKGWIEYFEKYNLPVPEGELGINPGAMSRSDVLDIVFYYP
ncbi:MAG: YiiX/YebB-like N1pC/P60 family cysteine hydrolase [Dysgonomonas sp.]